jgi:hypothetical protein
VQSHDSHEQKLMSIPIALMMAVVATLGAVVAYRAARSEQDTLRSERRLQQGKLIEMVERHEMLNKLGNRSRYLDYWDVNSAEASDDVEEAQSTTDRRRAEVLILQAQEDHALLRALQPYLDFFYVGLSRDSLEESLNSNAAGQLRNYGFNARWEAPAKQGDHPRSIWEEEEENVQTLRKRTVVLAGAVVLFVVALASLTFAQLFHYWRLKGSVVGMLIAAAGLSIAIYFDPNSWQSLLCYSVAFIVLSIVGHLLARKLQFVPLKTDKPAEPGGADVEEAEPVHPSEVDPTVFPGVRLHTAPVSHTFGRFTIAMIAITAVLSALSGFLYSRATARSAGAFSQTLEEQAALFKSRSRAETRDFRWIGNIARLERYIRRYQAADQRAALAKADHLLDLKRAIDERNHWSQLVQKMKAEKGLPEMYSSEYGPEQDRNFPLKLVRLGLKDSEAAFALSDANNESSLRWQRKSTIYLAILTFFAISLYLFGQGLSMGRTHAAFILVFFSCCLVAFAFGYGAFMSWEIRTPKRHAASKECEALDVAAENKKPNKQASEEDADEDVARHYAEGRMWYETSDNPDGLEKAAKQFACAIDVRPSFAMANLYRARSTELAGTPQINESGFVSITSKDSIPNIVNDERQALEMLRQQDFMPPASLQIGYSFQFLMEGLIGKDRAQNRSIVDASVAEIQKAVAVDETPVSKFNLGLGLLAQGNTKAGMANYEEARNRIKSAVNKALELNRDVDNERSLVAGAITDLETLSKYCEGVAQKPTCDDIRGQVIPRLKSELVAAVWPPKTPAGPSASPTLGDVNLTVTESGFGWQAAGPKIEKQQDVLSVLWYAYSPEWQTWRVLPTVSGAPDWKLNEQGRAADFVSVLHESGGRNCVAHGDYRAEFYVNGKLADTRNISAQHGDLFPVAFPGINLALCSPASWKPWNSEELPPDSLIEGYTDGNREGIFLFAYFNPRHQPDGKARHDYVRVSLALLMQQGLIPRVSAFMPLKACDGQAANAGDDLEKYTVESGDVIARSWLERDGLAHVAVVFSRHDMKANCGALISVTTLPDWSDEGSRPVQDWIDEASIPTE